MLEQPFCHDTTQIIPLMKNIFFFFFAAAVVVVVFEAQRSPFEGRNFITFPNSFICI